MQETHRPSSSDSADRRTELAADRTVLAAERTYAAWVRTGVAALAAGVGAKKVLAGVLPNWAVMITGSVLVLFGACCFIAGVWRELWPGAPPPQPDVRRIPAKALIVLNGFLVLVCLGTLLGSGGPAESRGSRSAPLGPFRHDPFGLKPILECGPSQKGFLVACGLPSARPAGRSRGSGWWLGPPSQPRYCMDQGARLVT
jgi:inner membrane protein YidH